MTTTINPAFEPTYKRSWWCRLGMHLWYRTSSTVSGWPIERCRRPECYRQKVIVHQ